MEHPEHVVILRKHDDEVFRKVSLSGEAIPRYPIAVHYPPPEVHQRDRRPGASSHGHQCQLHGELLLHNLRAAVDHADVHQWPVPGVTHW
jgi:hypothetical protein